MLPFIEIDHLSYRYRLPGGAEQRALSDVSLRIERGEYVAIVGANGSGKSTLARHLNGLLLPGSGSVRVDGIDTADAGRRLAVRHLVGMVFQRPEDQLVATTVEDDIAFGLENLGMSRAEMRVRVRETLEQVGLWEERSRPPHLLSGGQTQRVALAGVLAMRPECIVFDEATAMLDPAGRRDVGAMMERLNASGLTVVVITHFMEEAARARRLVVLAEGSVAFDGAPTELFAEPSRLAALGLDLPPAAALAGTLRAFVPSLPQGILTLDQVVAAVSALSHDGSPDSAPASPAPSDGGAIAIRARGLGHTYMLGTPLAQRALAGVSLDVRQGEVTGLLGATGSGKSTLLQHLNGLLRPQEGEVESLGYDLRDPQLDLRVVRRAVALAFQSPEQQIFEQYVGDEIAYGPMLQGLTGETLRERVRWAMGIVGLDFDAYKDRLTFALSGGEQRKVALASILALQPRALLLDEPTAGLDPRSRADLLGRLDRLQDDGMTLLLSSHRMEDHAALATRLAVLERGRSDIAGSTGDIFDQGVRLRELGLDVPPATAVAGALRSSGWSLPAGIYRDEDLGAALAQAVIHG